MFSISIELEVKAKKDFHSSRGADSHFDTSFVIQKEIKHKNQQVFDSAQTDTVEIFRACLKLNQINVYKNIDQ